MSDYRSRRSKEDAEFENLKKNVNYHTRSEQEIDEDNSKRRERYAAKSDSEKEKMNESRRIKEAEKKQYRTEEEWEKLRQGNSSKKARLKERVDNMNPEERADYDDHVKNQNRYHRFKREIKLKASANNEVLTNEEIEHRIDLRFVEFRAKNKT